MSVCWEGLRLIYANLPILLLFGSMNVSINSRFICRKRWKVDSDNVFVNPHVKRYRCIDEEKNELRALTVLLCVIQ